MSIRWIAGILGDGDGIPSGEIVTLSETSFGVGFGDMSTPGSDQPGEAWSRGNGATPTSSSGPAGGSVQGTRAVDPALNYAFTEGTPAGGGIGPQRTFTMESREFDASLVGLYTLTFDLHMRFGSEGLIDDGTLTIEGWNGSAWSTISNTITGSQQLTSTTPYLPSTDFGTYTSSGFSNSDFKFRFRFVTGAESNNYDCAIDNVRVTGPEGDIVVPPPAANVRAGFFNTGNRRLHVSSTGQPPLDGIAPAQSFTTIQAAINAAQAGDVITVGAGTYFEAVSRSNLPGTVNEPVWLAAEVPYEAIVSNLDPQMLDGTAVWRNDGAGIFSTPGSPAYTAWLGTQFLPQWTLSDLQGTTFDVGASASQGATTLNKPDYGFAFSGGRIHVELPDDSSPAGQFLSVTNGFSQTLMNFSNCDNLIVDGFLFEGAGDGAAVSFDTACANPTVKNCKFVGSQFGVRCVNDTIVEDCEFFLPGHSDFGLDLRTLNPGNLNALFRYHKNYNNAAQFKPGSNNSSDALMEGGIDVTIFGGTPPTNVVIRRNWIHEVFEGSKGGRHRSCEISENVFDECGDDGIELESNGSVGTIPNGAQALFHDNLIKNCFGTVSHQGDLLNTQFVYRNVMVVDDPSVAGFPAFIAKMINTGPSSDPRARVHWYHNTIINLVQASDSSPGFGTNHWIWFGFSNSTANLIANFLSNIVVMPNDLDSASVNPANVEFNVVASPADNAASAQVQGTNGTFAGTTQASMVLNADFSLGVGSPAIGNGRGSLPAGLPDSRSTGTPFADAGAFPEDFAVPANWPREQATIFDDNRPGRWTSPGA